MYNIEVKLKYKRSKKGLVTTIYSDQRKKSKIRGHKMPLYSKNELKEWMLNHPNFDELYQNWIKSNFNIKLKPSIDRLNNSKGYSFDNIQLITWDENNKKGYHLQYTNGNKRSKIIFQYSLDGVFINKYKSLSIAARETGSTSSAIYGVCENKCKQHNKYIWRYV